jgi:cytochrome c biogenesis protein CcdA
MAKEKEINYVNKLAKIIYYFLAFCFWMIIFAIGFSFIAELLNAFTSGNYVGIIALVVIVLLGLLIYKMLSKNGRKK